MSTRWTYLAATVVLLPVCIWSFVPASRPLPAAERTKDASEVEELRKAFEDFKKEQTRQAELVSHLSRSSPPVGSVVAFAGEWPPRKSDKTRWTEGQLGWLLCDGRKIEGEAHDELRAVLGANALPDYRGYFLRGADNGAGRDARRQLGSVQVCATKLPTTPFVTGGPSQQPSYKEPYVVHEFVFQTGKGQSASLTRVRDGKTTGSWTHTVTTGGDSETRPVNAAVHFIIKFK